MDRISKKNALRTLAWRFNSDRMVMEYVHGSYLRHIAAQQGYYPTPLTKEADTPLVIAQGRIDEARSLPRGLWI